MRLRYNIININYKVIFNIINDVVKYVNILIFKDPAVWLPNRAILPNRVSKNFFFCRCSIVYNNNKI